MRRAEHGGIFLRLIFLLVLLAFFALLYGVRHPLMRLAGQLWVVDEPAEHADVIVVLGDDNYTGDRSAHAAELYRAGLAPQVVASGRLLRPYAGVAEMIERDLESRGVPAVVTSNYHARRTRFIFGRVLKPEVTVRVGAARDSEFDPSHWWETRLGEKLFFNEVLGYAVAWWELRGKTSAGGGATFLLCAPGRSRPWPFPTAAFLGAAPTRV